MQTIPRSEPTSTISTFWRRTLFNTLACFDVVVASNLFGDILSDLGPAVVGGMGVAPGGNLNPERDFPSMFEPVHGSAPDIAGRGDCQPHRLLLDRRDDVGAPG